MLHSSEVLETIISNENQQNINSLKMVNENQKNDESKSMKRSDTIKQAQKTPNYGKTNGMYVDLYLCSQSMIRLFRFFLFFVFRNWYLFGGIVLLTVATRFYKVTEPDHVW